MKVEVIAIRNERDYRAAKVLIESLMSAESPEAIARLRTQALLVSAWEQTKSPPVPPDPIEAIRFRMEQRNLEQKDLIPYIGSKSKVSEVLNGQRSLTLTMIRKLAIEFGVPAEVLLRESHRDRLEDSALG